MTSEHPWFQQESFWKTFEPFLFSEDRFAQSPEQCDQVLALAGIGVEDTADAAGCAAVIDRAAAKNIAILDLCCGPGRHSLEFARRGFRVTGVDRTRRYLVRARKAASKEKLDVEFHEEDMHTFCRPGGFDLAINLFTSFGYSEDPQDDERVLANLYVSLRPGGVIVMELMGKEIIARIYRPNSWSREEDGTLFLEERSVDGDWDRMKNTWIMVKDGKTQEHSFHLRIFSATELKNLLLAAGFREAVAFGSLAGDPYNHTAKRLVVVGRK